MRSKTLIFSIALTVLFSAALYGQQENKNINGEKLNLDIVADNHKFQNGVLFVKLKKYQKAVTEFNEYLEVFYNGIHRNEAYKHLAEISFKRLDYMKAVEYYRALYEEYNNSDAGIEAYYKIGICFQKMGYDKKAMGIFKEIMEDHPDSTYAYHSRLQMDLLSILEE